MVTGSIKGALKKRDKNKVLLDEFNDPKELISEASSETGR